MRSGRDVILKAAMQVFAEKSYAGASIREICKVAGVTKPVLYYHFQNKEHLYQELLIDIFDGFRKNLLRSSKFRGTLREKLVNHLHSQFHDALEKPVLTRFLFRIMFSPSAESPFFNFIEEFERERDVIGDFFQKDDKSDVKRGDGQFYATVLMGMELIAILEQFFTQRPTLTRRSAERYVDLLLRGCADAKNCYTGR
jgi:AcrR family transcriptional regulator